MNKRKVELSVEKRVGAGQVLKPEKAQVDAWAVVERSGLVVRWFLAADRANAWAEKEMSK